MGLWLMLDSGEMGRWECAGGPVWVGCRGGEND